MLLVFAFAVRNNSVLLTLTGISFERALLYHKIAAVVTIISTALHGLAYVLARENDEEEDQSSRAFTGIVALGSMVALFLFSLGPIRRKFFEFFVDPLHRGDRVCGHPWRWVSVGWRRTVAHRHALPSGLPSKNLFQGSLLNGKKADLTMVRQT